MCRQVGQVEMPPHKQLTAEQSPCLAWGKWPPAGTLQVWELPQGQCHLLVTLFVPHFFLQKYSSPL